MFNNSYRIVRMMLVLVIPVLLAACVPQVPDRLPTLAHIPTDTPSFTPSITLTPTTTFTPSATLTFTLTPSLTFTPSLTPPPSLTPTITLTPSYTPSLTFTPSSTFTPSLTFTASPTRTPRPPTFTPTPTILPMIISFTSDLPTVPAGGQTVLRWQTANAESVTLDLLTVSGTVVSSDNVDASGQRAVLVTSNFGPTNVYRLTARRGKAAASRQINLLVQCGNPWFFNPAPASCPQAPAIQTSAKFQQFERGVAFFVPTTNNVYLLANNNTRVNAYPMDWDFSPLPVLTPPAGVLQPTAEIGYIWLRKKWSDGSTLESVLGWATAPQQVYNSSVQQATASDLYLKGPTGGVYKLALAGEGHWSVVGSAP